MQITLNNGLKLDGTLEQITQVAKAMGQNLNDLTKDGKYYLSQSKGLVEVSQMEPTHLRNALLKLMRERLDSLQKEQDPKKVVTTLTNFKDSLLIVNMLRHLDQASPLVTI